MWFLLGTTLTANNNGCEETENVKAPAQLSPVSLFIMGAAFCMVELTSAFPYFGFLALLTSYHLIFPLALLFMLIYNFMYMLPLILLYFGYNKLQGTTIINSTQIRSGGKRNTMIYVLTHRAMLKSRKSSLV